MRITKKIWAIIITVIVLLGAVWGGKVYLTDKTKASEMELAFAQNFVNEEFDKIA